MEMKSAKGFHPLRNLSLKWSFMLYVAVCALIALSCSIWLSSLFSGLQISIHDYYHELYKDDLAQQGFLWVNGEIVEQGGVWIYTEDLQKKFSDMDSRLYDLYGVLAVLVVPVVSVLCVLVTGITFYMRKLKKPLLILDAASTRIASGDLDFQVEYANRNEFGRLAMSFEIMRESLYATNRDMWRMTEERRRLNAAFAHDLRTPLTVLRGYCDFLLKYIPGDKIDSEKAITTLSTMNVYLKRLEGYTATMSSLQKLDEIELSPKQVDFGGLCEEIKNITDMLAGDKKVSFGSNGDGPLYIDVAAVSQVCENLVSNAVRYAENEIEVSCFFKDSIYHLSVSDDGLGFSPEALKNAAEPYFRDERDISDTAHFGIGLYICQILCRKHGGALTVENVNGGKATARFASLPPEK